MYSRQVERLNGFGNDCDILTFFVRAILPRLFAVFSFHYRISWRRSRRGASLSCHGADGERARPRLSQRQTDCESCDSGNMCRSYECDEIEFFFTMSRSTKPHSVLRTYMHAGLYMEI